MRHCPFNNCGLEIPDTMFACRKHWATLSYDQKRRVNDAYTDYLKNKVNIQELRRLQQGVLDEAQPRSLFGPR